MKVLHLADHLHVQVLRFRLRRKGIQIFSGTLASLTVLLFSAFSASGAPSSTEAANSPKEPNTGSTLGWMSQSARTTAPFTFKLGVPGSAHE